MELAQLSHGQPPGHPLEPPVFGTKPEYLTVSEIFNVECNAIFDMIVMPPLNKPMRAKVNHLNFCPFGVFVPFLLILTCSF